MKRSTRTAVTAGAVVVLLAGGLAAAALWSARVGATVPDVTLGAVRFGAASETITEPSYSDGGAPVTVTLPGKTVIEVLDQTTIDADPVVWRFTASGNALGIAGLNYDVAVTEQVRDDEAHDVSSGIAQPGTVLERSTLKVFRAGDGGDCSAVPATPETPEGEDPKNIYVFGNTDVELQAPGTALDGTEASQEWCAAISWNSVADGTYVNDVRVTSIAEDGSANGAIARWHSQIGFPPALELLGVYRNLVVAEATAEDTTKAKASAAWDADIYPDPSNEPDIVISLDPIVTNVNPTVSPRD
ncbi:hypothetical protein [Leucobacter aridicollis]|uniref:Uncharacterized protein n=1 Tax=Leucobacter aridicollis TaxID=283878 RepID=A0A852RLT2_9MICO|nr:hypothetical protein [Leucobacter aridicollis]MBL3681352.1 hypothetical protein [Leucobacter aridicollis]NYD27622.1 hypothetical protein [Leucobacter aridicollis]